MRRTEFGSCFDHHEVQCTLLLAFSLVFPKVEGHSVEKMTRLHNDTEKSLNSLVLNVLVRWRWHLFNSSLSCGQTGCCVVEDDLLWINNGQHRHHFNVGTKYIVCDQGEPKAQRLLYKNIDFNYNRKLHSTRGSIIYLIHKWTKRERHGTRFHVQGLLVWR